MDKKKFAQRVQLFQSIMVMFFFAGCIATEKGSDEIIAPGQMPAIVKDNEGELHIVYGISDSIMYTFSDNQGQTFSSPVMVGIIPHLVASHMRGPQIAATSGGLVIIACDTRGDIFSFTRDNSGQWQKANRINDTDTVAKEGLMALDADGGIAFATWLDLRDGHNKIVGSRSTDGGKTWSKNMLIYTSPDSSVCECCKPSVVIQNNKVFIMFRNWLDRNRDMYLVESTDDGTSFGKAHKLGTGSWALNGCPMDGGALDIGKNNIPVTIWRREKKIFTCEPGKEEQLVGEGKSCTVKTFEKGNVYAWTENGHVVVLDPTGTKKTLGMGQLPLIEAIDNTSFICIWEYEKKIHKAVLAF